jgi:hypothetical protein
MCTGSHQILQKLLPTDLLGLKHRTIAKNSSLLRRQFVRLLPELPANVSGLAVWQGWAERFIVTECLIVWQNDVFSGIEIPNEHLWMVQELCMESWRIAGSEHDGSRPSDTTRDPCLTVTDGQVVDDVTGVHR